MLHARRRHSPRDHGRTVVSSIAVLFAVFGSVDDPLTVGETRIENPPGLGAFQTSVMFGAAPASRA